MDRLTSDARLYLACAMTQIGAAGADMRTCRRDYQHSQNRAIQRQVGLPAWLVSKAVLLVGND